MSALAKTEFKPTPWGLLILCSSFLFVACSDDAKLVITNCSDQDQTPISREVRITVNNDTKAWKSGERCEFKIPLEGQSFKEVQVRADAGPDYVYNSLEAMTVRKGKPNETELRFYRPYLIKINAYDANRQPVENVAVFADGVRIGTTTLDGYAWLIEQSTLPGTRIQFELNCNGAKSSADPIILEKGRFEYTTGGTVVCGSGRIQPIDKTETTKPEQYTITIQTFNAQGKALAGVALKESGTPIGVTDKNGIFNWIVKAPRLQPGSTVKIELEKDGLVERTNPITIENGKFLYRTKGQLDIGAPPIETPLPSFTITIRTVGAQGQALAGVKLTESGTEIGRTNNNGSFTWKVKEPRVRVGSTLNIGLSKDGKTGTAAPITLESGIFSYETRGQLEIGAPIKVEPSPQVTSGFSIPRTSPYTPSPALVQCMRLADGGNYDDAIACLEKFPNPGAAGEEAQVKDYVNAQHLTGYLYWEKLREYPQAVQAFKNILAVNSREYSASYNLALVYYKTGSFVECRRACDMVIRLRHLIPVNKLDKIEGDVMFLKGLCLYRLYQDDTDQARKRQNGIMAISELEDFVARAQSLAAFQSQRDEAQEMIAAIEKELQ
jgi:hypothetical protein